MGLIAAVGTAVTAVAASVGVTVTATALTVGFTTIAAVGAVVGVVGQVTHNKVLSMVGLGLGAVGCHVWQGEERLADVLARQFPEGVPIGATIMAYRLAGDRLADEDQ